MRWRSSARRGLDASDGFAIDVGNHDAVRSICERVDRLPLGIELAAARLRAFTPAQLDARLADRLGGIGGSSPTRAARHQTMPATVAWSYDLLFEDERSLLRALSVFRGSFALDAVAPVAGGDAIEVEDTLARLVDKSLVVAEGGAPARYRLLRTVADFAASQAAQLDETSVAPRPPCVLDRGPRRASVRSGCAGRSTRRGRSACATTPRTSTPP